MYIHIIKGKIRKTMRKQGPAMQISNRVSLQMMTMKKDFHVFLLQQNIWKQNTSLSWASFTYFLQSFFLCFIFWQISHNLPTQHTGVSNNIQIVSLSVWSNGVSWPPCMNSYVPHFTSALLINHEGWFYNHLI